MIKVSFYCYYLSYMYIMPNLAFDHQWWVFSANLVKGMEIWQTENLK